MADWSSALAIIAKLNLQRASCSPILKPLILISMGVQEQMQESEEHYSLLLSEEHGKVEAVEKDFRSAC